MKTLNTIAKASNRTPRITNREMQVLRLIASEYSNKEIAERLFISVGTVEVHRRNLFMKTGASNMAGLIARSYQMGLLNISRVNRAIA